MGERSLHVDGKNRHGGGGLHFSFLFFCSTAAIACSIRGCYSFVVEPSVAHWGRHSSWTRQTRSALKNCHFHRRCDHYSSRTMFSQQTASAVSCATDSSSQLVDTRIWETYEQFMKDLMNTDRVTKNLRSEYQQAVQDYILSNRPLVETPCILALCKELSTVNDGTDFRDIAAEQRAKFRNATGFSQDQFDYLARCIGYAGDICAKKQFAEPAMVAFLKLKECGVVPRENTISTYLYVLSLSKDAQETCLEVASLHDLLYDPNEKTVTLRIKCLIARGDAAAAERVLHSLPCKGKSDEWKRLRTFSPILNHYCDTGEMGAALRLFRQMRQSDGVIFDDQTYAVLVASLARRGCFRVDADPIENILDHGFSVSSGPALFDELATEIALDLLELTESAAEMISSGFKEGHIPEEIQGDRSETIIISDSLVLGRVAVSSSTAQCPETGAKLRLFELTDEQRLHVHETLLDMARAQHEEYAEKLRSTGQTTEERDGQYAYDELCKFSDWLRDRNGDVFTAILDGPNIAYFGHGDVHYSQIQLVVEELEKLGEHPLVIMPQKYVSPNFSIAGLGYTQELSNREIDLMQNLIDSNKMYVVPSRCLDDYYWMLASVADQARPVSRANESQLTGLRPLLITNDQMRDHRLSLEPRLFRRWTSCHVVNYGMKPYVNDEWESRHVSFLPADVFSREIQCNRAELRGEKIAWHFPVTEWPEPDRFCVAILG